MINMYIEDYYPNTEEGTMVLGISNEFNNHFNNLPSSTASQSLSVKSRPSRAGTSPVINMINIIDYEGKLVSNLVIEKDDPIYKLIYDEQGNRKVETVDVVANNALHAIESPYLEGGTRTSKYPRKSSSKKFDKSKNKTKNKSSSKESSKERSKAKSKARSKARSKAKSKARSRDSKNINRKRFSKKLLKNK